MTQEEKETLSYVVSDLLTGNYLLGRKRSATHMMMLQEVCAAAKKVEKEHHLSQREKELMEEMSRVFHDGIDDMCEQLIIDKDKLRKMMSE